MSVDSAVMMGTACWPPMKMPPVSALDTEETTFCRVLQMTWMALLSGGASGGSVAEVEDSCDVTAYLWEDEVSCV